MTVNTLKSIYKSCSLLPLFNFWLVLPPPIFFFVKTKCLGSAWVLPSPRIFPSPFSAAAFLLQSKFDYWCLPMCPRASIYQILYWFVTGGREAETDGGSRACEPHGPLLVCTNGTEMSTERTRWKDKKTHPEVSAAYRKKAAPNTEREIERKGVFRSCPTVMKSVDLISNWK